eukprot:364818-Chlamydomonas_euryale.AAC.4
MRRTKEASSSISSAQVGPCWCWVDAAAAGSCTGYRCRGMPDETLVASLVDACTRVECTAGAVWRRLASSWWGTAGSSACRPTARTAAAISAMSRCSVALRGALVCGCMRCPCAAPPLSKPPAWPEFAVAAASAASEPSHCGAGGAASAVAARTRRPNIASTSCVSARARSVSMSKSRLPMSTCHGSAPRADWMRVGLVAARASALLASCRT